MLEIGAMPLPLATDFCCDHIHSSLGFPRYQFFNLNLVDWSVLLFIQVQLLLHSEHPSIFFLKIVRS
jgi:hypothetical protein